MKKALLIIGIFLSSALFLNAQTSTNYDYSLVPNTFSFTKDLGNPTQDQTGHYDVSYLQCLLGMSPTGYFGPITQATLKTFQENHAEAILTPVGLTTGTGYLGNSTRTYINAQITTDGSTTGPHCSAPTTSTNPYNNYNQFPTSPNNNQSTNNQSANNQNSILPMLPYLMMMQGGGTHLVNPNQPNNQNTNPPVTNTNPNPPVNNQGNNGGTTGGNPANGCSWPNHTDYTTGQCLNSTGQVVCPPGQEFSFPMNGCVNSSGNNGNNAGNAPDPTLFGGMTTYNSRAEINSQNDLRPCSQSEPDTYLVIVNNKANPSNPHQPIFLLVKRGTTKLHNTPLVTGDFPEVGQCVIGHYASNNSSNDLINRLCQDYTRDGQHIEDTVWPIHGLIDNFDYAAGTSCAF